MKLDGFSPRLIGTLLVAAVTVCLVPASSAADSPPAAKKPHYYGQVKAYCIGIDQYDSDGIPRLTTAEAEAKVLAETLQQRFGYSTETLVGKQATKAAISRILEDAKALGKDDALIIIFGGHGEVVTSSDGATRTGFLLPVDAKLNIGARLRATYSLAEFKEQAIEMRDFADKLKALPVGHVLLVADACHSGVLAKRGGTESQLLETVLVSPSRTVITSAGQYESARDGLFSVALNRLLTDAAAKRMATSTDTLFRALFDESVKGQKVLKQIPQIAWFGDQDGRFVFFPLAVPADEMADLKQRLATKRLSADPTLAVRGIQADLKERAAVKLLPKAVAEAMTAGNYWYGNNTDEDRKRWQAKREAYVEAAKFGDALGLAGLFFCTKRGFGGTTNPYREGNAGDVSDKLAADALKIALQAADANDREGYGKFLLGLCYLEGIGTSKRETVGKRLIEQSAAVNNPLAMIHQVAELQSKIVIPPNGELTAEQKKSVDQIVKMNKALLELEIPKGMLGIATAHLNGLGGYEKSLEKIETLLTRAAGTGDPEAMAALAYFTMRKDKEKAQNLLTAAADTGHAESLLVLAREYWHYSGYTPFFGFSRDREKAAKLFRDAADQDYPPAIGAAAAAFTAHDGNADPVLAKKYIERGKQLKVSDCWAMEANCYHQGLAGYEKSPSKALSSMQTAITCGHPDGTLIFTLYRIKGSGDLNEWSFHGYHWLMLAHLNCKPSTPQVLKDQNLAILLKYGPDTLEVNAVSGPWQKHYPNTYAEFVKLHKK